MTASPGPTPVRDQADLDRVLEEPVAVLYKHSPVCGLSTLAARQVGEFMRSWPDVPVYQVDVVRHRALARAVEHRLSTRHESPQALVLRAGEVVWSGSHRGVTAGALVRALGGGGPGDENASDQEGAP